MPKQRKAATTWLVATVYFTSEGGAESSTSSEPYKAGDKKMSLRIREWREAGMTVVTREVVKPKRKPARSRKKPLRGQERLLSEKDFYPYHPDKPVH